MTEFSAEAADLPPFRYTAALAGSIECKWQARWACEHTFESPNPVGSLSEGFSAVAQRPKSFIMDMFPYPSGSGLHVGHPLGYIGTDVFARAQRMAGFNVLHTMGYDAFGLPAEQFAVQTGQHPRHATNANIDNMRRQLSRLGLGHDPRRSISTTDPQYYRWTQWVFLQLFNAWYDPEEQRARPIAELEAQFACGERAVKFSGENAEWNSLSPIDRRRELEQYRLAYVADAPVNWCPDLGTVLANEEVTNDGRSERGNYPVYRRPMRQWMMRITAYADRLIEDLELLDWTDAIKDMQRNWIGRSKGAQVDFPVDQHNDLVISVFTTRPDTLFGATYMVLAPEHPLVESLTAANWPDETRDAWKGPDKTLSPGEAVAAYRKFASGKSEVERQIDVKEKTGVFTGSFARNPVNGAQIPIFVADYVLMGYGTGAIMAVPAHDDRDFAFARALDLPMVEVVKPTESWYAQHGLATGAPVAEWSEAFVGESVATASRNAEVSLDGLEMQDAKSRMCDWLTEKAIGKVTVTYKLRDWLFSRQRYWGEPFPIVWDENETPYALPESQLPVLLPEIDDYAPRILSKSDALPEPPLGRAEDWRTVTLDLGEGPKEYRRELNTMPQWAGSCWYYLRYIDPTNEDVIVDKTNEQYWMTGSTNLQEGAPRIGGVDLYVGGVEHAVLHLLYARFWHKVLFDLGHVSTPEPFQRLFNQGYVQADYFEDERGVRVDAFSVTEENGQYYFEGIPVSKHSGKMGKSLKNAVNPDDIYEEYGADALRLYEMSMGPLDADRPWTTTGIVGLYRFLQRMWRNFVDEDTGELRLLSQYNAPDAVATRRLVHRTIVGVREDFASLRLNTAIAKLIELNNHLTKLGGVDRETAEAMVLLLAPLAPHIAEELWEKLGHEESLAWHPFPDVDKALLEDDIVVIPVQVQGKVRAKLTVPVNTPDRELEQMALQEPNVQTHVAGKQVRKIIVANGRMVSIVTN